MYENLNGDIWKASSEMDAILFKGQQWLKFKLYY